MHARKASAQALCMAMCSEAGWPITHPDTDILDHRGVLRLAQVGRAGQQCHTAIAAQI
jgi:hypothetical protein